MLTLNERLIKSVIESGYDFFYFQRLMAVDKVFLIGEFPKAVLYGDTPPDESLELIYFGSWSMFEIEVLKLGYPMVLGYHDLGGTYQSRKGRYITSGRMYTDPYGKKVIVHARMDTMNSKNGVNSKNGNTGLALPFDMTDISFGMSHAYFYDADTFAILNTSTATIERFKAHTTTIL